MKHMWSEEEIEKLSKETPKDMTTLVDSAGNPRFIEGDGVGLEQEGVTITYCKWSLSGTHLMFVVAGTVANSTVIANSANIAQYTLPNWIRNKIYPVWGTYYIETKDINFTATDWSKQTSGVTLTKLTNTINITKSSALTLTANRGFRIQFDLLIDNE